ncbi:MAG: hypothetical protein M3Q03_17210 [Chloroflexota bacterium]|nr:hypothetical protein [Chloroflexota bacterium]
MSGNVSDPSVLVPGALLVVPARPEGAVNIDDLYAAGKPLNEAAQLEAGEPSLAP